MASICLLLRKWYPPKSTNNIHLGDNKTTAPTTINNWLSTIKNSYPLVYEKCLLWWFNRNNFWAEGWGLSGESKFNIEFIGLSDKSTNNPTVIYQKISINVIMLGSINRQNDNVENVIDDCRTENRTIGNGGAGIDTDTTELISLFSTENMSFVSEQIFLTVGPSSTFNLTNNSTKGENGTDEALNSFYFYQTEQFTVLSVLFTIIVLGNSAVLITLVLNKNQKSRMNFFIKQLAIADLCVGLLNVLTDIIWRITVSWRAGNVACKLIKFIQACVTYASTYVLVALSIDRYDAITHPMNFSGSWRRARRLVGAAWGLSALFSLPMFVLYEETLVEEHIQCWIDLGSPFNWQIYMCLVSVVLFVIPAIIIAACYAIIVRTIWSKGTLLITTERARNCGTASSHCIDRGSRRASSRGIIPRAKVKTVKMTIVIVIVFILCWSPYIVFDLLQVFGKIPTTQTNLAIATFIQSLAPLNSAANPLIYCLFSTQVCRALRRLPPFKWLKRWACCCCKSTTSQHRNNRCTTNGTTRLRTSTDSMRTLTTSLTVTSRRSTCMRPARVVIVERPKTILAMSEV